jgi:hypothetical protein
MAEMTYLHLLLLMLTSYRLFIISKHTMACPEGGLKTLRHEGSIAPKY